MGIEYGVEMIVIMSAIIFVTILLLVIFYKRARCWKKNNNSLKSTMPAIIVGKRVRVSESIHRQAMVSIYYYITFQFINESRVELQVDWEDYGTLVEGDQGNLTFQGPRYISFERAYEG